CYTFNVRSGSGGPGPNIWSSNNAWVDGNGLLHLKIAYSGGQWSTAEVYTDQSFGFGTYQFKVVGHPEIMDQNVVLGLFPYTTPAIGPDGTNEIDIEFATWGAQQTQHGNWTVWPAVTGYDSTSYAFDMSGNTGWSTHRFTWGSQQIAFQALTGLSDTNTGLYANWTFAPSNLTLIPQYAIPLHMNLWLFQGKPPADGAEVEMIISEFKFTPAS
ncbi:MAG: glycoside hydrolase family 16 protein, partial [Burkholderiaceae bacterium]|nr:glycoside hydrolase family 16 protein [Burkholderiaceae bacterium]